MNITFYIGNPNSDKNCVYSVNLPQILAFSTGIRIRKIFRDESGSDVTATLISTYYLLNNTSIKRLLYIIKWPKTFFVV
jgi:hypothetical protein